MTIAHDVRALGGAVQTAELIERGYGVRAIRNAVNLGDLVRPRKGWVAIRELDPDLMFAVTHGVVITCVSLARRHELWVAKGPAKIHAAVRSRNQQVKSAAHLHWASPIIKRNPQALTDSIPNLLHYVAKCQPFEEALTVWESAFNKGLADYQTLSRLPFSQAALKVLHHCTPFSDSGLETIFKTRFRWLGVRIRAQSWLCGHPVDFLIGDRLVIQIDGKQHVGKQKITDYKHDALLQAQGYHVIRVSYAQIMYEWADVEDLVLHAISLGFHKVQHA